MASTVDICNLALSHCGQANLISSINPPDGSIEAEHCARFYPIALDEALEMHAWTFATKRATLAELTNDREDFVFRYALPADCVKPRRILAQGYIDTEEDGSDFEWEGASIYTDAPIATLIYTFRQTDTTKFSPMFTIGLSWRLGGYIAGPIIKDASGRTQNAMLQQAILELGKAMASNANASRKRAQHQPTAARAR